MDPLKEQGSEFLNKMFKSFASFSFIEEFSF